MQVIYHGHSFVEIETEQGSILIDPFVTGNPKCDISLEDIFFKKITHILLTHDNPEYSDDIVKIVKKISDCVIVGTVKGLAERGLKNMYLVGIGGMYQTDDFLIRMVKADHDSTHIYIGCLVTIGGKIIYHAGDTLLFDDMRQLSDEKIDVALLPIGGVSTMDCDDAIKAAGLIRAKIVVPIHYNTFPTLQANDMHFAQQIMLKQYGVPKVLRAGQYVVL